MSRRNLLIAVVVFVIIAAGAYLCLSTTPYPQVNSVMQSRESGGKVSYSLEARDESYPVAPSAMYSGGGTVVMGKDRLVVRSGSMSSLVKDVNTSIKALSDFAVKEGGFVVSSYVSNNEQKPSGNVTVRVPVAKFNLAFDFARNLGEMQTENVNGQDITEEYIDLESQVRNLKATETQLLELMRRSGTVGDILNVQRELTNVRSQIERIEGRMKYLKESAAMSTLSVHFSTDPENLPVFNDDGKTWKPVAIFKEALRGLVDVLIGVGNFIIYFVVFIPVWLILALFVWLLRRAYSRFINR